MHRISFLARYLIDLVIFPNILRSEFVRLSVCVHNPVVGSFNDALRYRDYIASNDREIRDRGLI